MNLLKQRCRTTHYFDPDEDPDWTPYQQDGSFEPHFTTRWETLCERCVQKSVVTYDELLEMPFMEEVGTFERQLLPGRESGECPCHHPSASCMN